MKLGLTRFPSSSYLPQGLTVRTSVNLLEPLSVWNLPAYRMMPTLRYRSHRGPSYPPKDLDRRSPILENHIYSQCYAERVETVVARNAQFIDTVAIENEMNDNVDMWDGTVSDYLRLLLTARTVIKSIDPRIAVIDGGLQGHTLLKLAKGNRPTKPAERNAAAYLDADLFAYTDYVNFHYYQGSANILTTLSYLKKFAHGKPIMCNEFGLKAQHIEDTVEYTVRSTLNSMQLFGVREVIWFSQTGEENHNRATLMLDANMALFNTLVKELA